MGWNELENLAKEGKEAINKFDRLVCDVFSSSIGKELLEFLVEQYLHNVVASPQDPASYAYWREGQNSLVRRFVNAIKKNQQQTPTITINQPKPEEVKS